MRHGICQRPLGSGKTSTPCICWKTTAYLLHRQPAGQGYCRSLRARSITATTPGSNLPRSRSVLTREKTCPSDLERFPELLKQVREAGVHCDILFLAAHRSEVLIKPLLGNPGANTR